MLNDWKTFVFRDFLRSNHRPYTLGAAEDANLVGVRWYGEGPFHRELKPAVNIAKKTHFRLRSGDVIYNKLFAWKGSFGVVPPELDGMFVSDKFPTYELNTRKISERFLRWLFRYPALWEEARAQSTGSAAVSKLTLNPPKFLGLTIRAPERISHQDAIADRLDRIASSLSEIRHLKSHADAEIRALSTSIINAALSGFAADGRLGSVLHGKPRNGWSPRCDNVEDGVAVLGLGAVTGFNYRSTAFKRTSEPTDPDADYWLRPNDLLMSRSNTPELVGHAAIYSGQPYPCIYPDLMMRLPVNSRLADKRFVWYWLQTARSRRFVESRAKGTSPTMKKISQDVVWSLPFPADISVGTQAKAVASLDKQLAAVRDLCGASANWLSEFHAIIPAVLNREFGASETEAI